VDLKSAVPPPPPPLAARPPPLPPPTTSRVSLRAKSAAARLLWASAFFAPIITAGRVS
jgi:hypothetical protein